MQPEIKWTLEKAREDYRNSPIRKVNKKTCRDCVFSEIDGNGDIYCKVREKVVFFSKLKVKMCKYFNSRYLNRK